MSEESPTPGKGAGLDRGKVYSTATTAEASDKFRSPPRQRLRLTLRRRASHRLAELYRLAAFYRLNRIRLDPETWLFVLASTLGAGRSAWLPTGRTNRDFRWPGLTLETLKEAVSRCDLGCFDDAELETKIKAVEAWQAKHGMHLISMKRLGEMLNLTAAEREVCGIRTIDAVDEPRAERKARLAEARKVADREAKRTKRIKHGRTPREVYEAVSLSAKQPWKEAGVSRATWYRELKKGRETGVSAHHISDTQHGQTHLSQDANHEVVGPASEGSASQSVMLGVASQPGSVSLNPEPQSIRPKPSWAASDPCLGIEVESNRETSKPALHENHIQETNTQLPLFEVLPEGPYLPPSEVLSFRERMGYSQAEIGHWLGTGRSHIANVERKHDRLSEPRQRLLKHLMEVEGWSRQIA